MEAEAAASTEAQSPRLGRCGRIGEKGGGCREKTRPAEEPDRGFPVEVRQRSSGVVCRSGAFQQGTGALSAQNRPNSIAYRAKFLQTLRVGM